jgi:hypothetical protein
MLHDARVAAILGTERVPTAAIQTGWAVRRGAQVVFHPHAHVAEPGSYRPVTFADPVNTFHEKRRAYALTLLGRP